MAEKLDFFILPEDERALFRLLARHELTLYPELVPPGYQAPKVDEKAMEGFEADACYLAAERFGNVIAHPLKRGPDKGMLEIEEVPSPVFHYERSLRNDAGELVGGRLWAELDTTRDPNDIQGKPLGLRRIYDDIYGWFRKTCRRSDPKGFWVGPKAAAAWKGDGLVLREPGHHGGTRGV